MQFFRGSLRRMCLKVCTQDPIGYTMARIRAGPGLSTVCPPPARPSSRALTTKYTTAYLFVHSIEKKKRKKEEEKIKAKEKPPLAGPRLPVKVLVCCSREGGRGGPTGLSEPGGPYIGSKKVSISGCNDSLFLVTATRQESLHPCQSRAACKSTNLDRCRRLDMTKLTLSPPLPP